MALRLSSRLIVWNLLLIFVFAFVLSFFLTSSGLALVVAGAAGATAICIYGVRIFVHRPLRLISAASANLAAGNLGARLPITGEDEIAMIGTSVNAMARSIGQTIQALSDEKQQLESILGAMGQ